MRCAKGPRGFTIAETMVALVVLSIAVLGLVAVQAYSLRSSQGNKTRHEASEIASAVMASVESRLRKNPDDTTIAQTERVPVREGFEYTVTTRTAETRLLHVSVCVYYKDRTGEHSYDVWTYYFDPRQAP